MSATGSPLNSGYEYRNRVGPADHGRTVLDLLAARYTHSTRSVWSVRIDRGQVRLDQLAVLPEQRVRAGQLLTWRRPPWQEPAVPLGFALLHLDPELIAAAKPRGLPTLPGGGRFLEHTLLHQVRQRFPGASPAHRLGTGTSGIVLFGRTPRARARLSEAFRRGNLERRYLGLVKGHPSAEDWTIDRPIGPVPHGPIGRLNAAGATGKPSRTRCRVLERRVDGTALLELLILTGRSHQIRAHLAAAGHPLQGDPLFGEGGLPEPGSRALPSDGGYLLHARSLRFEHPATGRPLWIECAPPPLLRPFQTGREKRRMRSGSRLK